MYTNTVQVGFGKGTPSKMLWVDGIDPDMSESALERAMSKYGKVHMYIHHRVCHVCHIQVHLYMDCNNGVCCLTAGCSFRNRSSGLFCYGAV